MGDCSDLDRYVKKGFFLILYFIATLLYVCVLHFALIFTVDVVRLGLPARHPEEMEQG